MTDIEQKALELVRAHGGCYGPALEAAIEAHEADKARHAAELREQAERFSEAAQRALEAAVKAGTDAHERACVIGPVLTPFILAPVDPLVEAVTEMLNLPMALTDEQAAHHLRDALDARGFAIVKKEAVNG